MFGKTLNITAKEETRERNFISSRIM